MDSNEPVYFSPVGFNLPSSMDPLQGDRANNAIVFRMIYSTLLEVDVNNKLTSQLLDSFFYSEQLKKITLKLKKDIFFSDGQPITADDIAFSVTRMAYSHPEFPVIREIIGLSEWRARGLKKALSTYPKGIIIDKNNNEIEIYFSNQAENPLARLSLELFSVIPRKCVDVKSNLLICKPPSSGLYTILNKSNKQIEFQLLRQPLESHKVFAPKTVIFNYYKNFPLEERLRNLPKNTILWGTEFFTFSKNIKLNDLDLFIERSPVSYFMSFLINPKIKPFDDVRCRQLMAEAIRSVFVEKYGKTLKLEKSLFSPILPGQIRNEELNFNLSAEEKSNCLNKLKRSSVSWVSMGETWFDFLVRAASETLGVELLELKPVQTKKELEELFISNKIAFYRFGSGFWAVDPIGDLQMILSPDLHPALHCVSSNPKVRSIMNSIGDKEEGNPIGKKLEKLNTEIFYDASMNTITYFNFFYAANSQQLIRPLPLAVQLPYPWQIFNVK